MFTVVDRTYTPHFLTAIPRIMPSKHGQCKSPRRSSSSLIVPHAHMDIRLNVDGYLFPQSVRSTRRHSNAAFPRLWPRTSSSMLKSLLAIQDHHVLLDTAILLPLDKVVPQFRRLHTKRR